MHNARARARVALSHVCVCVCVCAATLSHLCAQHWAPPSLLEETRGEREREGGREGERACVCAWLSHLSAQYRAAAPLLEEARYSLHHRRLGDT